MTIITTTINDFSCSHIPFFYQTFGVIYSHIVLITILGPTYVLIPKSVKFSSVLLSRLL